MTQDLKYHVMTKTSARKIRELLESKYLTQSIKKQLQLKRRFYRFQLKKEIFIDEHMNNYTKLLADLANVEEVIKDADKALILLSSLRMTIMRPTFSPLSMIINLLTIMKCQLFL